MVLIQFMSIVLRSLSCPVEQGLVPILDNVQLKLPHKLYDTKHEAGLQQAKFDCAVATTQLQWLEHLSAHPLHGSEPAQEFAGCEVCDGIEAQGLLPAPHSSFAPQHHWLCITACSK